MRVVSSIALIVVGLFVTALIPVQVQGAGGALKSTPMEIPTVMDVTWTDMSPATGLNYCVFGSLVYDPPTDRYIKFGGLDGYTTLSNTTWAYDLDSNNWQDLAPSISPMGSIGAACVYDSNAELMVLFATADASMLTYAETWIFNATYNIWVDETSGTEPSPRLFSGAAFDSQSDVMIMFGGVEDPWGGSNARSDTWAYDLTTNTWTDMNTTNPPSPRYASGVAYDSQSDRMILYGGAYDDPMTGDEVFYGDTWAYDFDSNTWTNMSPSGGPGTLAGQSVVYDPASDRVLMFGGYTGMASLNELWAYDYESNSWNLVPQTASPPARHFALMAINPATSDIILYGGLGEESLLDDTWHATFGPAIPEFPSAMFAVVGTVVLISLIGTWRRSRSPGH